MVVNISKFLQFKPKLEKDCIMLAADLLTEKQMSISIIYDEHRLNDNSNGLNINKMTGILYKR